MQRTSYERLPKMIMNFSPVEGRMRVRPRLRWLDDVEDDLRLTGMRGWRRKAEDSAS